MNKKLIITGGARGIGKAVAIKFASGGFDIAFCGRDKESLAEFERELAAAYTGRFQGIVADVASKAGAENFGKEALDFLGGCQVLINNAGLFIPGSIAEEDEGVFERQMAINLNAGYYLTRQVLPALKIVERAHIFNMCSIASIRAYANGGSYCISKYAALGLTRVLREELKPYGVAVTAVMPGATLTESWSGTNEPPSRFMRTTDIAEAIWSAYSINENTVVEDIVMRPVLGDI